MSAQESGFAPSWLGWPQTVALIKAFDAKPGAIRFVGGAVRDAVLGREVQDVDAATTLQPAETMALLEKAGIRVIPTGIAHGTVTAVAGGKSFEITTLRKDIATDGRHAQVAFTDDWEADASRRDFTMNALYLAPDGTLYDYFGGVEDAKAGRVRFIGDAGKRIAEDFLRALRFFRFFAHYGQGNPDTEALRACATQASYVNTLSGERVQHELFILLKGPRSPESLHLMQASGLMPFVLGFAISDCAVFDRLAEVGEATGMAVPHAVKLAAFIEKAQINTEDALTKLSSRLRLSNHIERSVHILLQWVGLVHTAMDVAEQKRMMRKMGKDDFVWSLMLSWALGGDAIGPNHSYIPMFRLAESWKLPLFPLRGDDLIEAGVKPGKAMGELLEKLEEQWEESDYSLSKEQLLGKIA